MIISSIYPIRIYICLSTKGLVVVELYVNWLPLVSNDNIDGIAMQ